MTQIVAAYKTSFGRSLSEDLQSELSGHLGELCQALCMSPIKYDAHLIHQALHGKTFGTDKELLIEVLVGKPNNDMKALQTCFKETYEKDLEKELERELSGNNKRLFISLIQVNQPTS